MRRFRASELKRFLRAVDRNLSSPFRLVIIGGSAALLGYGVNRITQDIDIWGSEFRKIGSALAAAKAETGLEIPVEYPGVEDAPYDFEDRLKVLRISGLDRLLVLIPEKHDLVLMKMIRGEEPDLEVAEEIKEKRGLDPATLITRYLLEMKHITGDLRRIDLNFLALMDRLFGADVVETARERLESQRAERP